MAVLLLDIGNSKVKSAYVDGSKLGEVGVCDSLADALSGAEVERVLVASTRKSLSDNEISTLVADAIGVKPEIIKTPSSWGQLKNSYNHPEDLGVDRWLGLVYAWQNYRSAACVVSLGTCLTYDEIDNNGQHLGGLIAPGLNLSHASLKGLLKPRLELKSQEGLGQSTLSCIELGTNYGVSAITGSLIDDFLSRNPAGPVLISGGDSALVAGGLQPSAQIVGNIVLKALLLIANN
jgi:type III pantothenate kinase